MGRLWVDSWVNFWSVSVKTDQKPTEPLQDPDRRLPLRSGEGLWLKKVLIIDYLCHAKHCEITVRTEMITT